MLGELCEREGRRGWEVPLPESRASRFNGASEVVWTRLFFARLEDRGDSSESTSIAFVSEPVFSFCFPPKRAAAPKIDTPSLVLCTDPVDRGADDVVAPRRSASVGVVLDPCSVSVSPSLRLPEVEAVIEGVIEGTGRLIVTFPFVFLPIAPFVIVPSEVSTPLPFVVALAPDAELTVELEPKLFGLGAPA
jgi:hypothetical protein